MQTTIEGPLTEKKQKKTAENAGFAFFCFFLFVFDFCDFFSCFFVSSGDSSCRSVFLVILFFNNYFFAKIHFLCSTRGHNARERQKLN